MITKTCTKCQKEKAITEFRKNKSNKDGFSYYCKDCLNMYSDRYKKARRIYAKTHKKEKKEYDKKYRETNKEKIRLNKQKWRKENRVHYNIKQNLQWHKRRQIKMDLMEDYTKKDREYTMNLFNHKCANCGSTENLCIDHHYPLSKGNPLTRQNAVILCNQCNTRKYNKDPIGFYTKEILLFIESKLFNT